MLVTYSGPLPGAALVVNRGTYLCTRGGTVDVPHGTRLPADWSKVVPVRKPVIVKEEADNG